jgi:hypothetical protein
MLPKDIPLKGIPLKDIPLKDILPRHYHLNRVPPMWL